MTIKENCPPPTLAAGDRRHGFLIRRIEQIPEIRVTAYEIEHEKTGAKVLHLHCDDRENLFSIGFRTPPRDSTGRAPYPRTFRPGRFRALSAQGRLQRTPPGNAPDLHQRLHLSRQDDLSRRQPGEARFLQPRPRLYRPGPPAAAAERDLSPGRPPFRIRRTTGN